MAVRQLKGLNHCKLLKRRAKRIWRKTGWQTGMWEQCLKTAIESHRQQCESELISKRVQQQLAFSSIVFDGGDWE